eukprot:2325011-Amphidinium_carterae.1
MKDICNILKWELSRPSWHGESESTWRNSGRWPPSILDKQTFWYKGGTAASCCYNGACSTHGNELSARS